MRKRDLVVHVVVLGTLLAVSFGIFQSAGAVTSLTSPKPKLEVTLDQAGREAYACTFDTTGSGNVCDVPANYRLVVHHIDWLMPTTTNGGFLLLIGTLGSGGVSHVLVGTNGAPIDSQTYYRSWDGTLYFDSAHVTIYGAAFAHAEGTIVGDLLQCNRILAGTTSITADCNANVVTSHN